MEKNQNKPNGRSSQDDLLGYEGLIAAMLKLMMKDLTESDSEIRVRPHDSREVRMQKMKRKYYKRSAYRFVRSEWFDDLCWGIGVDPHSIRRRAIERYIKSKKK